MMTDTAQAYLRTKVLSAGPEELRLMLLEGALRFTRQGREGLVNKDFEASYAGFTKCRNILMELMNVKPDVDPELKRRVTGVYTFLYMHLTEGSFEKDIVKIDKVIELLEYERETWMLAMDAAAKERGSPKPGVAATIGTAVETAPVAHERRSISLQG